ncbi:MAG: hypothetical protein GY950_33905 [bacterium]|nr:hypothetical protein [bacterium]
MDFLEKLKKRFVGSAAPDKDVPPQDDKPSGEIARKSAIRRKLKDIGYRTEEINTAWGKKEEGGKAPPDASE